MFLDIHTHQQPEQSQTTANNRSIINVAVSEISNQSFLQLEVSLGLHPWYLTANNLNDQIARMEEKIGYPSVKLIGECGFDKLKGPTMDVQKEAFKRQLEIAEKYNKPVIIHCVRAFDELIAFKKNFKPSVPLIVHGFNKHPNLGKQLLDHGFLLSFGSSILRENNPTAELIQEIEGPFFLETDDSSASIETIYERVSFLRKTSLMELKGLIFAAWKKIGL